MLNFLYTTDLHGKISSYETILRVALAKNLSLIHLGADFLPKGSNILDIQKDFIKKYLSTFYARCKSHGIEVLAFFGNDDIYTRKKYFKKFGTLLDEVPFLKEGYEFKAYPYVQDYPFGLKTACKWDSVGWQCPDAYIGAPVDFTEQGQIFPITDPVSYFANKGTIKDDLKKISANQKTVIAIHQPPDGLDLDVCRPIISNKQNKHWTWASEKIRKVGSKAVHDWIKKRQPLLVLCGHIHENYAATNVWKAAVGKTTVIQPGQCFWIEDKTRYVLITLEENSVNAELFEEPDA